MFVIRRQQVVRQTIPLLQFCFYCLNEIVKSGNALRAAIAGLSYYLQFLLIPHGSSRVLHHASFIRSSFHSLHHARNLRIKMFAQFLISTSAYYHISTLPARLVPFTHSSLLHFSKVQYTTLPILLCSPCLPSPAFRGFIGTNQAHASMPHKSPSLCAHHGLTAILLCAPVAGTRRSTSVHSFLIHSSARCRLAGNTALCWYSSFHCLVEIFILSFDLQF